MALFTRLPFNFSGSAYTPPSSSLSFDFTTELTQWAILDGWDSVAFSSSVVTLYRLQALSISIDSLLFGAANVRDRAQKVYVPGYVRPNNGDARIANSQSLRFSTDLIIAPTETVYPPNEVYKSYYRPAAGNNLYFNLGIAYTAPTGLFVQFEQTALDVFRSVFVYGHDSLHIGEEDRPSSVAFVAYRIRTYSLPSIGDLLSYGTTKIRNSIFVITPYGRDLLELGIYSRIWTNTLYVRLRDKGFLDTDFGGNQIEHREKYVNLLNKGTSTLGIGTLFVSNFYRGLIARDFDDSVVSTSRKGLPYNSSVIAIVNSYAEYAVEYSSLMSAIPFIPFAAPYTTNSAGDITWTFCKLIIPTTVSYRVQKFECLESISDLLMSISNKIADRAFTVTDAGNIDSLLVAAPIAKLNTISTTGFDSLAFGPTDDSVLITTVSLVRQIIAPAGLVKEEYSVHSIFNWVQYLYHISDDPWYDSEWNRGFGSRVSIRYRNLYPQLTGFVSSRVSYVLTVYNDDWGIFPPSIEPTSYPTALQADNKYRYVFTKGSEPYTFVSTFNSVANNARLLVPTGVNSLYPGVSHFVAYYTRSFRAAYFDSTLTFGQHVTGFTPRYIETLQTIHNSRVAYPVVWYGQRDVVAESCGDLMGLGNVIIIGPFKRIIKTSWPDQNTAIVGLPQRVYNKTPEIRVGFGVASPLLTGLTPWVSYRVRSLLVPSASPTLFGIGDIRDRTIRVYLRDKGITHYLMSGGATVRLVTTAVANSTQVIIVNTQPPPDENGEIPEYVYPETVIPSPEIRGQPFLEGWQSSIVAEPRLQNNGIAPKGIIPAFIYNLDQGTQISGPRIIIVNRKVINGVVINPTDAVPPVEPDSWPFMCSFGKPGLQPYYVFCEVIDRANSPKRADFLKVYSSNNGNNLFAHMGLDSPENMIAPGYSASPWGITSRANLVSTIQTVALRDIIESYISYVRHTIRLPSQGLTIAPQGINSFRFSYYIEVFPHSQDISVLGFSSYNTGGAAIYRDEIPDGKIRVQSLQDGEDFGRTQVQNFRRYLYAQSFNTLLWPTPTHFGTIGGVNYSVSWPLVGYDRAYTLEGFDMLASSDASTITHRVRTLLVDGFDAFESVFDDDFQYSYMTVRWKTFSVIVTPFISEAFGTVGVQNKYLFIRPYGVQGSRCLGHNIVNFI